MPLVLVVIRAAMALGASPSEAHGTATGGALAGLFHPLLGVDHLLMLLAMGTDRVLTALSAWVVGGGMAIHGLLHGLEASGVAASSLWWGGALLSSAVVCGGTGLVLRLLPQGWGRDAALALLLAGGLLVFTA